MPILFIAVALALISAILGGLAYLGLRLAGFRQHFRPTLKWTGIAYTAALPITVLLILPLLTSYLLAHASTRPMDRALSTTPSDYGRPWEEAAFTTTDGIRIRGWYLPGEPGHTPFVFGHGLFRDRHEVLERSCRLNERGFPALIFDFRGHGQSQASIITLGYREKLDVEAAAAYLRVRTGSERVTLCGVSMGAVSVVLAAAEMPPVEVAAVVADSPFASLRETVERHADLLLGMHGLPFSGLFLWNFRRIGEIPAGSVSVLDEAPKFGVEKPILLIYGREDRRMPPETATEIFDAVPGPNKKLIFIDGADHGAAYRESPEVYLDAVEQYLPRFARH